MKKSKRPSHVPGRLLFGGMEMDVRIRRAVLKDAPELLEIYRHYVLHTAVTFEYEVPSVEEFQSRMCRIMQKYPYLVAEAEGRIIGYAYAGPFHARAAYGWAAEMTVYLDHRCKGKGAGRKLYEALEKALGEMGVLNLYACIGVPEEEDEYLSFASERFHEHMGFVRNGFFRRCGYKFGRWYHMIWMEKIIGEHGNDQPPVRPFSQTVAF